MTYNFNMRLFSFFIFLILLSPLASAAQVGIVKVSKAIIYSDIELKSPIGYVRKGKQLAVGEVKRRRGEILPVSLNGRVGWVRVSSLRLPAEENEFDQGKKVTEHELNDEKRIKDPLGENNYLSVRTGPGGMSVSGSIEGAADFDSELTSSSELSMMYEHKNPYYMTHWGVGLDYFTGKFDNYEFQSLSLKAGFAWVPIRLSWVSIEAYANLVVSGDFRVNSVGLGEYKGNMYGADYGGVFRLLPEYKIGLLLGAGLTYYRFSGLTGIQNNSDDTTLSFNSITGTKVFAGLSYSF